MVSKLCTQSVGILQGRQLFGQPCQKNFSQIQTSLLVKYPGDPPKFSDQPRTFEPQNIQYHGRVQTAYNGIIAWYKFQKAL